MEELDDYDGGTNRRRKGRIPSKRTNTNTNPSHSMSGTVEDDNRFTFDTKAFFACRKYSSTSAIGYTFIAFPLLIFYLSLTEAFPNSHEVYSVMLFLGFICLTLMGIFEFHRGNMFNLLIFFSFGAFFGINVSIELMAIWNWGNNVHDTKAMGTVYLLWSLHNIIFFALSFKKNIAYIIFFALNMVALIVHASGIYDSFNEQTELAAGILGACAAGVAYYIALAVLLNNTYHMSFLPLGILKDEELPQDKGDTDTI